MYEEAYLECLYSHNLADPVHSYAFRVVMEMIGELDKLDDFKEYLDSTRKWLSYTEAEEAIALCKEECDRLEDLYDGSLYAEDTDFEEKEGN